MKGCQRSLEHRLAHSVGAMERRKIAEVDAMAGHKASEVTGY